MAQTLNELIDKSIKKITKEKLDKEFKKDKNVLPTVEFEGDTLLVEDSTDSIIAMILDRGDLSISDIVQPIYEQFGIIVSIEQLKNIYSSLKAAYIETLPVVEEPII